METLCEHMYKKGIAESEQEKNMSEMFQFLHLALHFLESTAPLITFKWQNSNISYVNSSTTIELQIINDNR